jgi:hypothetical protein
MFVVAIGDKLFFTIDGTVPTPVRPPVTRCVSLLSCHFMGKNDVFPVWASLLILFCKLFGPNWQSSGVHYMLCLRAVGCTAVL